MWNENKTKKQFAILFSVFFVVCVCIQISQFVCLWVGGWLVGWLDFMLEIWLESHPVFFAYTHTPTHTNENCIYWNQSINQSELLLLLSSSSLSFDYYCKKKLIKLFVCIYIWTRKYVFYLNQNKTINHINQCIDRSIICLFFCCFCFCVVFFVFFSNVKIIIIIVIINEWMNEKIFFFLITICCYMSKKKKLFTHVIYVVQPLDDDGHSL